jgi:hypothetical protein
MFKVCELGFEKTLNLQKMLACSCVVVKAAAAKSHSNKPKCVKGHHDQKL